MNEHKTSIDVSKQLLTMNTNTTTTATCVDCIHSCTTHVRTLDWTHSQTKAAISTDYVIQPSQCIASTGICSDLDALNIKSSKYPSKINLSVRICTFESSAKELSWNVNLQHLITKSAVLWKKHPDFVCKDLFSSRLKSKSIYFNTHFELERRESFEII